MFTQPMKTAYLLSIAVLLTTFTSCTEPPKPEKEPVKHTRTLTISSDSASIFDMRMIGPDFKNGSEEYLRQATPFQLQIESQDVRMIFKKVEAPRPVRYSLSDSTTSVSGSWLTTVMIIDGDHIEVFGM